MPSFCGALKGLFLLQGFGCTFLRDDAVLDSVIRVSCIAFVVRMVLCPVCVML